MNKKVFKKISDLVTIGVDLKTGVKMVLAIAKNEEDAAEMIDLLYKENYERSLDGTKSSN